MEDEYIARDLYVLNGAEWLGVGSALFLIYCCFEA